MIERGIGEAIGSLELIAHSAGLLNKRAVYDALHEASLQIQCAPLLSDRLPWRKGNARDRQMIEDIDDDRARRWQRLANAVITKRNS